VTGGFDVIESDRGDEFIIAIVPTPDRDFNVCDGCNEIVHFKCSLHPETGYCDRCFLRYRPEVPDAGLGRAA